MGPFRIRHTCEPTMYCAGTAPVEVSLGFLRPGVKNFKNSCFER